MFVGISTEFPDRVILDRGFGAICQRSSLNVLVVSSI